MIVVLIVGNWKKLKSTFLIYSNSTYRFGWMLSYQRKPFEQSFTKS